ncbi:LamB/YcsF family protein [Thermaerobacter marianensis DSM 12885]|uniref:5-oxoprolinase subunit A n=1 Tax=Thermaerobacter marianensis (strain ATCC 700841 / DSM 12885 / JCM 10246 / 7p75a) TaxID=644966 RepID=E6SM88_THEM7|nr:5-oxoprolinase subunit PxpA [Thermaerobacter marianensis]ADU51447.1 LamB/YcsF family protein [Thermaerobacter marianensis DSM 12885]
MSAVIDLNCDLGESFGAYTIGMDEETLPLVSSANIACGFHGGDPRVMERTVQRAAALGVGIGAHVGFPDRVGFGRREIHATADEVRTDVIYQIGALYAFCRALGVELQHVKPHGALYNQAARDAVLARAVVAGIAAFDRQLIVLAPPGSELARAAAEAGLPVALEGFADRGYNPDGSLVSRRQPGAVLHDPAEVAARAERMVREGKVRAVDGTDVALSVHSLCIHGDNPASVSLARAVRQRLEAAGVGIRPLRAILRG